MPFDLDPRLLFFAVIGLALLAMTWLPRKLEGRALSLPILYVAFGAALFALPLGLRAPAPLAVSWHAAIVEYGTEFIVIVSLAGAGFAIDRRVGWRAWRSVWRLLGIAMPLTILATALVGWAWLGLAPASALLLAAVLSPTDPVLARSVQVGPPNEDDEDEVRFALTAEAGLNDGLAFPFTYLAIAAAGQASLGGWVGEWAALDLAYRCAVGIALGVGCGYIISHHTFEIAHLDQELPGALPPGRTSGQTREGELIFGSILLVYGLTELVGGYGFLAVFVAALTGRSREREHRYHERVHQFADQAESILLAILLIAFGGMLTQDLLQGLTLEVALAATLLVVVVRPLAGWLGLVGSRLPRPERFVVAFFGIRGMGSLYYLAYGQRSADFPDLDVVWATVSFAVLLSIVLHGISASPVLRWLGIE